MTGQTRSVKLTYEDYVLFPDDGKRHEIIDGEHYVTPAPNTRHQAIVVNLLRLVAPFVYERRLGRVYAAPIDVVLSEPDIVQPDLIFVSAARASIVTATNVQGAPDLAVEILSEGSRRKDEVVKRKLYQRSGVAEYWIVDPELETGKVYRLEGSSYRRMAELSNESGDALTTPLLPGLKLPLSEVFE